MMRRRVRWREFFAFLAFLVPPFIAAAVVVGTVMAFGIAGLCVVVVLGLVYLFVVGFTERR